MNPLVKTLHDIHPLSSDARESLEKTLQKVVIEKEEFILREGQVCHRLFFIEAGCFRGYYHKDGKEITHWFGFEKDIVTSFNSFINKTASIEHIQALETSVCWSISYNELYQLYDDFPEVERLGRITCEQYYIKLEDRYVNAQFQTATERYNKMLANTPHILQRIPLGHIASYLGISQETLSRIRAKGMNSKNSEQTHRS